MPLSKKVLQKRFAKDWKNYYNLEFFKNEGFVRKVCRKCGKGFWTLDPNREFCADQPCSYYEFLGDPPTKKRFDYIQSWKHIERFFVKHNHTSVRRYPVVCRWFPLFFNAASIVNFYRVENGNVTFEFPANPLIVPQFCLRFNDIPNVGITGKHYTTFCMIGQHSIYNGREGYWKERCIELDYLLLKSFGIKPEDIIFVESLWVGPGAFGSSIEYFSKGLEIGNAVFTEFLQTESGMEEMREKVIDMGAGLERFAWITHGTPTSYDIVFEPVLKVLKKKLGIDYDKKFFLEYSRLAGILNIDEVKNVDIMRRQIATALKTSVSELNEKVAPLEALYAICDHANTLTFAISDGAIPSNVSGGYNLRVILRRALSYIDKFNWDLNLVDVCELHAKHLKTMCPELLEHVDEINRILEVEVKRFYTTKERTKRIVKKLVEKKKRGMKIDEKTLINLYDSEGITPEMVKEHLPDLIIPSDFYVKVTERHLKGEKVEEGKRRISLENLPPTHAMYYDTSDKFDFNAKVLRIIDEKYVVLDQTLFYPKGGGQQCDLGSINNCKVLDVEKIGDVIIHELEKVDFKEGDVVLGTIDRKRRDILTKHHTATHIINTSARDILGSHVWQAGSEKTVKKARLDITHYEALSDEEIESIENRANEIVRMNIPIFVKILPRSEAEKKYGFRIYQGGAVPNKYLRIVEISGVDVEACGGLHRKSTGEVGWITILSSERIADGTVRLEYTCSENAIKVLKEKEKLFNDVKELLKVRDEEVPKKVKDVFDVWKDKTKELDKLKSSLSEKMIKGLKKELISVHGLKLLVKDVKGLKSYELREIGNKISDENTVVFLFGIADRIYVFCKGNEKTVKRNINIGSICRDICEALGGKGGGSNLIGEGFGLQKDRIEDAKKLITSKF